MPKHLFSQVDVFSDQPMLGNPVAVVHDAIDESGNDLDADVMLAFARWTNLSETTFVLPPRHPDADYRLRIFTPGGELPFAGHPTLGSCRAWLAVGGVPRAERIIVQECEAGLVRVRRSGGQLAFAAPPLTRFGPPDDGLRAAVIAALGVSAVSVVDMSWVVNGPNWLGVLLDSAQTVLAVRPDVNAFMALDGVDIGVIGPHSSGSSGEPGSTTSERPGSAAAGADTPDFEVRAFCPSLGVDEDPVTGSLQAGLAQWLIGSGVAPRSYLAAQGTVLHRAGLVSIEASSTVGIEDIWVGGDAVLRIAGAVDLS
ncbi:MAG: PhzF family phenazine biosynthesis protein [Ornithinimicrobium sp.]